MKFLLTAINAKYIHTNLALYSLKAFAKQWSNQIELVEYTINNYTDEILQDMYKRKPDFIGFSCYIWNIDMVKEIAKELKKVLPETPIWLGGPEVSYDAQKELEEAEFIDGIMVGEGEQTFLELVEYYDNPIAKSLNQISGIVIRQDDKIIFTGHQSPLDLSTIPFPYTQMDQFNNKIIYYETSRGCPYSCSYCLSSIEKGVRLRDLNLVKQELQIFLDQKVPQVKFIDRTFNCNRIHSFEIWKYLHEHDNGITNFHFEISADLLREEDIALIHGLREGLIQLEIGVQSTNPETIQAIHRTMDFDKLSERVNQIQDGGNVHQHLDLIAGLPYEDYSSFRNSFNDVYALRPNQLQLGFLKVLKGSLMFEESKKYGIVYKEKSPYEVLYTKWLNYDMVLELKKIESMVEVYYNSGQFSNSVAYLTHFYDTPFDMYKSIGDYYERKNLAGISHTRMNRYTILLDFFKETVNQDTETFGELLVYDLYLRENLKNRPAFGEDNVIEKEDYRNFYSEEEALRTYLPGYEAFNLKQISKLTHLERFHIDLEETIKTGKAVSKQNYILFDYQNRHPHTYEARTIKIEAI